ncbi:LysR family transcriptional regulator [Sphingomonas solaris]|uniref:LysR family transcriptional regulator n=1 Tax=Alterirhizorhabdus solaris TaxID=2529389 RepID=A0A558RAZ6_9SPHN|nr:LysR family transcriptional regulator [Sphingomonas solaris]TVV76534.1 LysR family transcriptional regulator [Sphingomonas solaris]
MRMTSIDPAKLRHFVAVLDAGTFALAAQRLGISQPAISKSIRATEERLGVPLFERGRAGARPTDQARLLAAHARGILAEYALADAELHALGKADAGALAIGASLSLAQSLLPDAIAAFRRRWPDVALAIDVGLSEPLFARLLEGELDFVISAPEPGFPIDARIDRTFLLEEQDALVVGADHPLLAKAEIALGDLLAFPWIVPRRSARIDRIHAVFAAGDLPPPARMLRAEASELARGLLMTAPFICLIGASVLGFEIETGRLATLPDLGFGSTRPAYLARRRGARLRLPARNLATLLTDAAKGARP